MKIIKVFMLLFSMNVFQTKTYATSNNKIDNLAHSFMKDNKVKGMSIAVLNKDKTTFF